MEQRLGNFTRGGRYANVPTFHHRGHIFLKRNSLAVRKVTRKRKKDQPSWHVLQLRTLF